MIRSTLRSAFDPSFALDSIMRYEYSPSNNKYVISRDEAGPFIELLFI